MAFLPLEGRESPDSLLGLVSYHPGGHEKGSLLTVMAVEVQALQVVFIDTEAGQGGVLHLPGKGRSSAFDIIPVGVRVGGKGRE